MNSPSPPLAVALKFFFKDNHRVPKRPLPSVPLNGWDRQPAGPLSSTWLGHSTVLMGMDNFRILTDPVLVNKVTPAGPRRFRGTLAGRPAGLPPVDLCLISHDHYDHLNRETLTAIRDRTRFFAVPRGLADRLAGWGIPGEKIRELAWWETWEPLPGLRVTATPSRHFSGRGLFDRNRSLWASWIIRTHRFGAFFSGDSGYFNGFSDIGRALGPFDVTFVECGAYDRAWQDVHMFPEETVQAHLDLNGTLLHPIHWGTFNLALHPWYAPMERLTAAASKAGVTIATPMIGQRLDLSDPAAGDRLGTAWWKGGMAREMKGHTRGIAH